MSPTTPRTIKIVSRVNLGLDEETSKALREVCDEEQIDLAAKCRAYVRDGLRRDGGIVVAKKTA